jgi:hypothetical protein
MTAFQKLGVEKPEKIKLNLPPRFSQREKLPEGVMRESGSVS